MIHKADIKSSLRLQKFVDFVRDHPWATTKEIGDATNIEAVGTTASEVRANGIVVECKYSHTNENGSRIYKYKIA